MKLPIKLAMLLLFTVSIYGAGIGNITALIGAVSVERDRSSTPAKLGLALAAKDTVVTAKEAKAQLTFNDNTIITVGKQSRFSIEEYLFDATSASTAKFNMISGTMRAMSGKIGKIAPERFAVTTKTATIGIRGTDFLVSVLPDGSGIIACTQGSIIVHDASGNSVIVPSGFFVTVSADGRLGEVQPLTPEKLNQILTDGFALQDNSAVNRRSTTLSNVTVEVTQNESEIPNPDESMNRGIPLDIEGINADIGAEITTKILDIRQIGTDNITNGY